MSGGPRIGAKDSKQDYATPLEFIEAVDLAAHAGNTKCSRWFGPGRVKGGDAMIWDWKTDEILHFLGREE